ncbi:MAG: type II secretion system GspH family protein [Actinomycetota bacterium]|nr:type II secretion system GspH family protein [Actinomycetota bacterium]
MFSFFTRAYNRLHRDQRGFTVVEAIFALAIIFVVLLGLVYTATIGFSDIALARQRQSANQIANKILEQVRGLSYARIGQGLRTTDQAADNQNIVDCPDGARYYRNCPASDPNAEKIVHSADLPNEVPLVPHIRDHVPPHYPNAFKSYVYVTEAKNVPLAGAYRVLVHVTWTSVAREGARNEIVSGSLIYTPEGTTDPTTGGGTYPFFYGTGSVSRAPVTITPGTDVGGGTGVTGLPQWDSLSEDLYGLDANIQQQQFAKAEGKAVMTGARKVVGGIETTSGGATATSTADDDPATPPVTSDAPPGLTQSAVSMSVAGGGNSLDVVAASTGAAPTCPTNPRITWLSGVESGAVSEAAVDNEWGSAGTVTVDSSVKRSGSYSLRVSGGAINQAHAAAPSFGATAAVLHFAIRLPTLPNGDVQELTELDITGPNLQLGYESSTKTFRLTWEGVAGQVDATVPVIAGTWHNVDVYVNVAGSPDVAEWQVDGVAQPSSSTANTNTSLSTWSIGTSTSSDDFTANFDDMARSSTAADYPLPELRVGRLLPNGMGPNFGNLGTAGFANNGGTPIDANTWTRLDDVPMTSAADYVLQANNATANYVEITFDDTTEGCILGVEAIAHLSKAGNPTAHSRTDILEGSQATTLLDGDPNNCCVSHYMDMVATAGGTAWTTSKVNGLIARFGYSNDTRPNPWFHSFMLQYAYMPADVVGPEGPAGTETGSTASTTAASAATACGNPTQVDGRACSYAREDYSTAGPPHLTAKVNLTGSGAGKCTLFRFTPSTAPGSTSYVWGRRTPGSGGSGTVKESVVRYYGTNELAALCTALGDAPAGWPGYWVKYDAGTTPSQVHAEAGIGSAAPSYTSGGTISYWNGSGVSTMTQPPEGGIIPVAPVSYTANGYRVEISGSLASGPSRASGIPAGAAGTADRFEARAILGSPVAGTFTYKVTNTLVGGGTVIANLTVAVDLGGLTATTRFSP